MQTYLLDKIRFGVQSETLSRSCSSSTSSPLIRTSFTDRTDQQTLHSNPRVVNLLFRESRIDDVDDSIDSEGSFGDVG